MEILELIFTFFKAVLELTSEFGYAVQKRLFKKELKKDNTSTGRHVLITFLVIVLLALILGLIVIGIAFFLDQV